MKNTFLEIESKEFKDIVVLAGLDNSITYLSLTDIDREIKKNYLKGVIDYTNYKKWIAWDEDTRMIALRRYIFYTRKAL